MRLATICRWTARLAATAIAALFIAFLVGEGTPDLRDLTDQELLAFGAVFLMVLGTLFGWLRDLPAALLIFAGYGAFAAIEHGWPPAPFAVWPAAGLLFLLSRVLRLFGRKPAPAEAAPAKAAPGPAPSP
jgi:hypothetical protein